MIPPKAILFDMDGTLTEPLLDFDAIRRDMGLPAGRPILESMDELPADERETAWQVLLRHEADAAKNSTLNGGCHDVLAELHRRGIGVALITRNSLPSVKLVMQTHGLSIDVLISRDCSAPKPSPEPLLMACQRLNVRPHEAWMVGDGVFDVQAGLAADIRTVWLSHGKARKFRDEPWREIATLEQLLELFPAVP